ERRPDARERSRGIDPFFGFPVPQQRPRVERGSGSGFIVSQDGYILTNNHVVDGADKVSVRLLDRRIFQAKVVGTDPTTDVAVLKIEASRLTPARLGSSNATRIGEWVLAVGNPLGADLQFTVTSGIVSAKGRGSLQLPGRSERSIQDFIQTDAAINPGNSGGPLLNVRGEVIGINSAIASETGYYQGYGFAIPIDLARQVMDQLIKTGRVERAALGVLVQDADELDAEDVRLNEIRGVEVTRFTENSPAQRAGLEIGDIILSVDGQQVQYIAQLQQVVGFRRPGETVKVEVARKGGVRKTYNVRLAAAPGTEQEEVASRGGAPDADSGPEQPAGASIDRLGINVSPLTAELARELGLPVGTRGLLVQSVDPEGPADNRLFSAETRSPDVILSVDGNPVRTEADLRNAIRSVGKNGIVMMVLYNPAVGNGGGRRVERIRLSN
ncbi:MAG TPA: trypsin-like peptidase domain-containing protein, partial [Gemmatimonadales bacterium]|nr:trypsin-like peptidase domain-containing protein [Gemmatimonadales bacterium]